MIGKKVLSVVLFFSIFLSGRKKNDTSTTGNLYSYLFHINNFKRTVQITWN